jgi:Ca2+-binding RTX toxin-like protein
VLRGTANADDYDFSAFESRVGGVAGRLTLRAGDGADTLRAPDAGGGDLAGEDGDDVLIGGAADDILDGGAGADTMEGGDGNDTLVVDDDDDVVVELAGGGRDGILASITIAALTAEVEDLLLLGAANLNGFGNELDNAIIGNAGNNSLRGEAGAYTLFGGGGADTLNGGTGNDLYLVGAGDVVSELFGNGEDTIIASVNWLLGTGFEHLELTDVAVSGTGNTLANLLRGNANNNTLNGVSGADTLFGEDGNDSLIGGIGNDVMAGGAGNDTYSVESIGDTVTETISGGDDGGIDLVTSTITYTLGEFVENLTLLGSATLSGTGNALDNHIIGNLGANQLEGMAGADTLDGGSGADTMVGGTGDDVYRVERIEDVVVELAGGGIDLVQSSISYALGSQVEHLTLLGTAGTATGNGLANRLQGTNSANTIAGAGGADTLIGLGGNDVLNGGGGNDVMIGGLGSDRYTVDSLGDAVVEAFNEGNDTVVASVDWTLGANLEGLILSGTADLDGTGNELINRITGNAGANMLFGLAGNDVLLGEAGADTLVGGAGGDVLTGGADADWFLFNAVNEGVDRITDFEIGVDQIAVLGSAFGGLAAGALAAENFVSHASIATTAPAGTAQFIFYSSVRWLYFDADGQGGAGAVRLATFNGTPSLTAADIVVI